MRDSVSEFSAYDVDFYHDNSDLKCTLETITLKATEHWKGHQRND